MRKSGLKSRMLPMIPNVARWGVRSRYTVLLLLLTCCSCSALPVILGSSFDIDLFAQPPTVEVQWPDLVLRMGTTITSDYSVAIAASRDGQDTVLIRAKRVSPNGRKYPPYIRRFNLADLGFTEQDAGRIRVYWVNRDHSKVLLERQTSGQ